MAMPELEVEKRTEEDLKIPANVWKILLEPVNHGLASMAREALRQGVPAHTVIEMLLNHLASVVAMIEPSGVRNETTKGLVSSFATMVQKHVDMRTTTESGLVLPRTVR